MDFGLAIKPQERTQGQEFAGTPAYMAHEQLAGMVTSVKSDIYSLGLVLYELFTGRRVFEASTIEDLRRQQMDEVPRTPSSYAPDIDPGVDRVIMRCLAREPGARPASALEVAATLPGGDPLKAALAAGRTPTPEMVAAAGGEGSLKPLAAWGSLALFAALFILVVRDFPRPEASGARVSPHAITRMLATAAHARARMRRVRLARAPAGRVPRASEFFPAERARGPRTAERAWHDPPAKPARDTPCAGSRVRRPLDVPA